MIDEIAPELALIQVYLRSASFAHRGEPLTLLPVTEDAGNFGVGLAIDELNDGAVTQVRVHITNDPESEKGRYELDVEMAAIIEKRNDVARALPQSQVLEIGAALLYPYVRELVSNLTGRGRLGAVWLHPFNVRGAVESLVAAENANADAAAKP